MNIRNLNMLIWVLLFLTRSFLTYQQGQSVFMQLPDASISCSYSNYVSYSADEMGLSGSSYTTFTYSFWYQNPSASGMEQLAGQRNLVLARFNSMPETGNYNRLLFYYVSSNAIMEGFVNELPVATMSVPSSLIPRAWSFFSQTIDYNANTISNYIYYPTSPTDAISTVIYSQTFSIPNGTSDIILDNDILYLGGATDASYSCGTFQRIFINPTTSTAAIPNIDVLRLGSTDIYYVAIFQFNEFQGQLAHNPLNSTYNFSLGSDPYETDANDPTWDRAHGGLSFAFSNGAVQYISDNGGVSLMYNGYFDFTFEWEISISQPSNGFQFLQKGTLLLSFNANNSLVVTFNNIQQSFNPVSLSSGFNAFRLYCSNYQRLTIFCELWINEQYQGRITFPFQLAFSDNSSSPIMIPPPSSDGLGSCLWSYNSNCYKVNPSSFEGFTCPSDTYPDAVSYTCASCPVGCAQCVNGSLYGCTSCSSGFTSIDGECQCNTGTYYDWTLEACRSCVANCDSCANSSTCSLCSSGYYYISSSNVCSQTCPAEYTPNTVTRTCDFIICSAYCVSCTNSSYCAQCQSSFLLENGACTDRCSNNNPYNLGGTCVSSCPQGYANQTQNTACVPCDSSCLTCANSSTTGCLTCSSSSFLQNGMCIPCNSSCQTCSGNANNCTFCPSGSYLLGSSCVLTCPSSFNAIASNRTCIPAPINCSAPMALTSTGSCVYCGGNCALCSNTQTCSVCNLGLVLQNGICTIPNVQSTVSYDSGVILSISALSLLEFSTSEAILVKLSQDVTSANQINIFWILFATSIAPDYTTLSCTDIQEIVSNNFTKEFSTSILQIGSSGFGYMNYTNTYGIYLNFTGLRTALYYNYTICAQQVSTNLWNAGSIQFQTKNNGYSIHQVNLATDTGLLPEDLSPFLCALSSSLNVSNSKIMTAEGSSCSTGSARRLLKDELRQQTPISRVLNAASSTTSLDLLIYGDPTAEQMDASATQIISKLTSKSFMNSFVYNSIGSSEVSIKISEVTPEQELVLQSPQIATETFSYEVKGDIIFFPNITFSGVDGFAYLCLVPNNSLTNNSLPCSADILSAMHSNSQSNYIIKKIRFFNGEAFTVALEGINPNTSYAVVIFGTNEDQSDFAFRTPRILIQAILGVSLPKASVSLSYLTLIATEIGAVVLLFATWLALFRQIKLYNCLKFKICKCRNAKLSQDNVRKTEVCKVIEPAKCKEQKAEGLSVAIDLPNEEAPPSPERLLNVSSTCIERLGGVSNRINKFDTVNSNSLSHIPFSRSPNMSHLDIHRVEISQIEDAQKLEVEDCMASRFDLMTQRRNFRFMRRTLATPY